MINTADLEKKLMDVETEISSLAKTRYDLQKNLRAAKETNIREIFSSWNITEDNCLVMFSKTQDDFYSVLTFNALKLDDINMRVDCIFGCYSYIDDELSYRISKNTLDYASIVSHSNKYSAYVFDKIPFTIVQNQLCSLNITTANHKKIESTFAEFANKKIS